MAPIAIAAMCCLVVLFVVFKRIFSRILWSFYLRNFTSLAKVPAPHQSFLISYTLGDPWFSTLGALRRIPAVDVVAKMLRFEDTLGPLFILRRPFGTPVIQVMDPAVIQQVLVSVPYVLEKECIPRCAYKHILGSNGLVFAEGDTHKRMRRIIGPSYFNKALMGFASVFLDEAEKLKLRLCTMCKEEPQGPLVLSKAVASTTCSSIMRSFFPVTVVTRERRQKFFEAYSSMLADGTWLAVDLLSATLFGRTLWDTSLGVEGNVFSLVSGMRLFTWVESRRRLLRLLRDEAGIMIAESVEVCKESVRHGATDLASPTMVEAIIRNGSSDRRQLSGSELYDTLLTTMTAGQSTVAMSLMWTFYLLAKHPEWQLRVQRELDSCSISLDSSKSPEDRLHALDGLPVLNRVVKESLRINPPVLLPLARTLKENTTFGDIELPAGSTLTIPIYAMHMNPKYWADPEEFDPDRFLPEAEAAREKMAYLPFLYGPRGCIGHRFAVLEIKSLLAVVLDELDFSIDDSADDSATAPQMSGALSFSPKVDLYARARSRSGASHPMGN